MQLGVRSPDKSGVRCTQAGMLFPTQIYRDMYSATHTQQVHVRSSPAHTLPAEVSTETASIQAKMSLWRSKRPRWM